MLQPTTPSKGVSSFLSGKMFASPTIMAVAAAHRFIYLRSRSSVRPPIASRKEIWPAPASLQATMPKTPKTESKTNLTQFYSEPCPFRAGHYFIPHQCVFYCFPALYQFLPVCVCVRFILFPYPTFGPLWPGCKFYGSKFKARAIHKNSQPTQPNTDEE